MMYHEDLLHFYQTWLDDFTRLVIRMTACHQNITYSHKLTVGSLTFPEQSAVTAIVPRNLYRIINGNTPPVIIPPAPVTGLYAEEFLLIHHPMLEGVLLSECIRLNQRSLANKLTSLFHHYRKSDFHQKLIWLCWYDLMLGTPMTDWLETLKHKSCTEMVAWINDRQAENDVLTRMMDEYAMLSCLDNFAM